jgi:hypothetical protein
VIPHVLSVIRAYDEIPRTVVLSVEVLVVYLFARPQWPTNRCFYNYDVLKHIAFPIGPWMHWEKYFLVALLQDKRFFSECSRAWHRAKLWIRLICNEPFAALSAIVFLLRGFSWRGGLRVRHGQVVLPTEALSKVRGLTKRALPARTCGLALLRKPFASLPKAIARRATERPSCSRMDFPSYRGSALMACLHDVNHNTMHRRIS